MPPHPFPTPRHFADILRRHSLDAWFPRSIDEAHGGFLCDFDREWRPAGPHEKLLEFQARQTLLAAEALAVFPDDVVLRRAALHGFAYLRDVLWDAQAGGWFHRLDREGRPLEGATKHTHGMAYALQACVAVHDALPETGALDLALKGFAWIEAFAHDKVHGGYFGFLDRDGVRIASAAQCPWPQDSDTIGTPFGLKDMNVHGDMLEALGCLCRAHPDPVARRHLSELVTIYRERLVEDTGRLCFLRHPDWTPVSEWAPIGYHAQASFRLLLAGDVLGTTDAVRPTAMRALDYALRHGLRSGKDGFITAPAAPSTGRPAVLRRDWWVQTEALKALMIATERDPDHAGYREARDRQCAYVIERFLDPVHSGMFASDPRDLPAWRRALTVLRPVTHPVRKGDAWKDGSHDGRLWLRALRSAR